MRDSSLIELKVSVFFFYFKMERKIVQEIFYTLKSDRVLPSQLLIE